MLLLVKASHALLDRSRTGFDVEGVLGDFSGDFEHFCRAPHKYILIASEEIGELAFLFRVHKYILIASEEIGELAFLFRVQTCPHLHGLGRVSGTDVHDLGVLVYLENA
jgi:hypothetical protein